MDKKRYVIDDDLLQALVVYLAAKPFREVAGFMKGLEGVPEFQQVAAAPTEAK